MRQKHLRAEINLLAERALVLVEAARHPRVLRALPGEHHHDESRLRRGAARPRARRGGRFQCFDGVARVAADNRPTVLEGSAPDLQGVGNVCEIHVRVAAQVFGKIRGRRLQRRLRFGGQGQQLTRPARARRLARGRFFENDVGVGSADAETTDARAARRAVSRGPLGELRVDEERRGGKIYLRVGLS